MSGAKHGTIYKACGLDENEPSCAPLSDLFVMSYCIPGTASDIYSLLFLFVGAYFISPA